MPPKQDYQSELCTLLRTGSYPALPNKDRSMISVGVSGAPLVGGVWMALKEIASQRVKPIH